MAMTLTITEAAHAYGMDDFATMAEPAQEVLTGAVISSANSWGAGVLPVDQQGTVSVTTSGGFTQNLVMSVDLHGMVSIHTISLVRTATGETLVHAQGRVDGSLAVLASGDNAVLFAGNDTLRGNSHNNILQGYGGNDMVDGGAGTDTYMAGMAQGASRVRKDGQTLVLESPGQVDTLVNVERIRFDDGTLAFDMLGAAGQAYRLYGAALNRLPDAQGLGFQVRALDSGLTLKQLAQNFLRSPEYQKVYGQLDDAMFVTKIYGTVLHRPPDSAGLTYQTEALKSGAVDRSQLLVNFSESPENQARMVGTVPDGIFFV